MARNTGAFNGSVLDDQAICQYDGETDITIAAGEHPHTANPLYREVQVEGNLLATYRPNTNVHGLSRLQVGISTGRQGECPTEHGFCRLIVPTPSSITYNADGHRVIDPEAYQRWSALMREKRHAEAAKLFTTETVPSEGEVRENLAIVALDGDVSDRDVLSEVMLMLPKEKVDKYPHAERGPRILAEALTELSTEMLEELERDELTEMLRLAEEQGQTTVVAFIRRFIDSDGPSPEQQSVMRDMERITEKLRELEQQLVYAAEWERVGEVQDIEAEIDVLDFKLAEKFEQLQKLGEALKGLPPTQPMNWGIPSIVYRAYNFRATVKRSKTDEFGDVYVAEEPSQNMMKTRRRFVGFVKDVGLTCAQTADMAVTEYGVDIPLLRRQGDRPLTYDLVSQVIWNAEQKYARELESWSNGADAASRAQNMGDLVSALAMWDEGLDARPRPEMSSEPVAEAALGEFEEEALKRDLSRKSTPRDEQVWMGELAPWSADVPFISTENGFAGHPVAWLLQQTLDAMAQDYDNSQFSEVVRLLGVTFDAKVDGAWLTEVGGETGKVLAMDGKDFVVLVQHEPKEYGFVYEVQAGDRWVVDSPRPDGGVWSVGDYVAFRNRLGFLAWRAELTQFPTLEQEDGRAVVVDGAEGPFIPVAYKPLSEVFPKLMEFISWAKENADEENSGLDGEMASRLWELQKEVSDYEQRMLNLVVEANIEEHFVEFRDELTAAWKMWEENPDIGYARGEFTSLEGTPTSLYGRLSSMLWASLEGLTEKNIVIPRPAKITGQRFDEESEEMVNIWGVNEVMLWRVMGYSLHPQRFRHGLSGLTQMVKEAIVRPNPMDVAKRTVWYRNPVTGKTHRKMVSKRLVTWTDTGCWSMGVLGDALADWWQSAVGLHASCVKGNILGMGKEELVQKLGWDPATVTRATNLARSWGRSKELRNSDFGRFVELLLPMPAMSAANFEKCQEVLKKRLQLMSPAPKLTGELFDQAVELLTGGELEVRAFLAVVRSGAEEIGTEAVRGISELLAN